MNVPWRAYGFSGPDSLGLIEWTIAHLEKVFSAGRSSLQDIPPDTEQLSKLLFASEFSPAQRAYITMATIRRLRVFHGDARAEGFESWLYEQLPG